MHFSIKLREAENKMKFALCNEMFEGQPMAAVCETAARLGYHGLEIAPFTLAEDAGDISPAMRREVRKAADDAGIAVAGLHWLFKGPQGVHMTTTDDAVWQRTRDYLRTLIDLCADLGGEVLVVGSPNERSVAGDQTQEGAWKRAADLFAGVLDHAAARDAVICLEPLSPVETNFINTVADGLAMVNELAHPNFKIHLDVKAMASEGQPIPDIIRSVPLAKLGHFHVNDPNLYGPGMGDVDYAPIAEAIDAVGWDRWLSVEVFKYDPDPETIARQSMDCLKRFW